MKKLLALATIVALAGQTVSQITFTKCSLAAELLRQGFARETLPDWVCLVEAESSFRTYVTGGPNTNGSFDWGLFQINDNYWCYPESGIGLSNDCNIDCGNLIDDDITDDCNCVRIIYARHGYTAWNGWKAKCDGQVLPDLSECDL